MIIMVVVVVVGSWKTMNNYIIYYGYDYGNGRVKVAVMETCHKSQKYDYDHDVITECAQLIMA